MLQCLSGMVNNIQQSIRILKQNRLLQLLNDGLPGHEDFVGQNLSREIKGIDDAEHSLIGNGPWSKLNQVRIDYKYLL